MPLEVSSKAFDVYLMQDPATKLHRVAAATSLPEATSLACAWFTARAATSPTTDLLVAVFQTDGDNMTAIIGTGNPDD